MCHGIWPLLAHLLHRTCFLPAQLGAPDHWRVFCLLFFFLQDIARKVNDKGKVLRESTCVAMGTSFAVNKDALWGKKKRNFMVGQIKQKNQNISLFPMFYFETKLPLLTAVLYLVFISNPNVFLNKSLNSFLVHHLNWINDFRHLPLTLAEMG